MLSNNDVLQAQVCGSTFLASCKLDASSLYKCDAVDSVPIMAEKCGNEECAVTNGDHSCSIKNRTCLGDDTLNALLRVEN